MTRHKHAQTGLVTPQLPQLLLTAVLRMLAMLVLHVASTLQMIRRRAAVNATQPTPTDLPQAKTDTHQETNAAQQSSPTTPSVSLGSRQAIHLPHTACGGGKQRSNAGNEGELPPPVENWGRWIAAPSRRDGGGASQAHRHLWKREPRSRLPGEALPVLSRQKRATRPSSEPLT